MYEVASPEYLIAANYVADRFAEIGLQPGVDDGWFQQVPFITAAIDTENSGVIIVFLAVTGEEDGLFGSDYFAQNPTVPPGSIVANVNVDMPVIIYPMSTMTVYGLESSTLGPPTIEEVAPKGLSRRTLTSTAWRSLLPSKKIIITRCLTTCRSRCTGGRWSGSFGFQRRRLFRRYLRAVV